MLPLLFPSPFYAELDSYSTKCATYPSITAKPKNGHPKSGGISVPIVGTHFFKMAAEATCKGQVNHPLDFPSAQHMHSSGHVTVQKKR